MEIRGASAAESAADPVLGSASLSPRNPTPRGQATGTGRGNARNPLDKVARRFASSHQPHPPQQGCEGWGGGRHRRLGPMGGPGRAGNGPTAEQE